MRTLILEGVPGTGKSRLFVIIRRMILSEGRLNLVTLSEHLTERVLEPLRLATVEESHAHLRRMLEGLEALANLYAHSKFKAREPSGGLEPVCLLERFHLSHVADIGRGRFEAYEEVDHRTAQLGGQVALLKFPESDILERTVRTTRRDRGTTWSQYLDSLGPNDSAVADHFCRVQGDLLGAAGRSLCKVRIFDATESLGRLSSEIHSWAFQDQATVTVAD